VGGGRAGEPCVMYVPGYGSGMEGNKAERLSHHCAAAGFSFARHAGATLEPLL